MNSIDASAQVIEAPKEKMISSSTSQVICKVSLPPVGKKNATVLDLILYGNAGRRFLEKGKEGDAIFISDSTLHHDLQARTHHLEGGSVQWIDDSKFGILNKVILSGRCIKTIDSKDELQFRTTSTGLMICNQSLSIVTGRNKTELFNIYAINNVEDKFKLAELMCNYTRKGSGLTIKGKIITDGWFDKRTNEQRTTTKIQVNKMTLGPRGETGEGIPKEVKPQTAIANGKEPKSLWGGQAGDNDMPDLPEPVASVTKSLDIEGSEMPF